MNNNLNDLIKSTQVCIYSVYRNFNEETVEAYKVINEAKQKSEKTEFELALTLFNKLKDLKAIVVLEYVEGDTFIEQILLDDKPIDCAISISTTVLEQLSDYFEDYFLYDYREFNCAIDFTKEV